MFGLTRTISALGLQLRFARCVGIGARLAERQDYAPAAARYQQAFVLAADFHGVHREHMRGLMICELWKISTNWCGEWMEVLDYSEAAKELLAKDPVFAEILSISASKRSNAHRFHE